MAKQVKSAKASSNVLSKQILEAYRHVLLCVFFATIFAIVLLFAAYWAGLSLMIYVVLTGALGAFFSALIRLYSFDDLPKALMGQGLGLTNPYLVIYSLIPMLVGAIAAAALYVAFASGLIKGGAFPDFDCYTGKSCAEFDDFVENFGPVEPVDYAKALIWSFIAGFSERIVPDFLKRISAAENKAPPQKTK